MPFPNAVLAEKAFSFLLRCTFRARPLCEREERNVVAQAAGGAVEAGRLYGRVLDVAGGDGDGGALHAPLLRGRLLRSATHVLSVAQVQALPRHIQ